MLISIDLILDRIKLFYSSKFWAERYYKKGGTNIDLIKEMNEQLVEDVEFTLYKDNPSSNGMSYSKIIALNSYVNIWKQDIEHYENLIMHEFGHIQYRQPLFKSVVKINEYIFNNPLPNIVGNEKDFKYFSDKNELRQRIIPLVKTMWENNWSAEQTYDRICKYDDIFNLYDRDMIIYWIDNVI